MNQQYELKTSNYYHPEQTTGQHTNGPANIFVRLSGEKRWYVVDGLRSQHETRKVIELLGWKEFVSAYGREVGE